MILRNAPFVLSGLLALALCGCGDHPTEPPTGPFDIAFTREPTDGSRAPELWVMRADGTNQKQLISNAGVEAPSWSPDGSEIAFSNSVEFEVIDVETGAIRKIATGFGRVRWYPDGARITLSAFPCCYSPVAQIFTVNPDGTNPQQLTFDTQLSKTTGDWSPDGSLMALTGTTWNSGNPYVGVYLMRADGSAMTRITDSIPSGNDPTVSWSPDGSMIAFVGDGNYIGVSALRYRSVIWTVKPDGTGLTKLSGDVNHDSNPSWSPDGKQIVFTSERDGHPQIYVMNADGTSQVRLVTSPTNDRYPAWRRR